MKCKYQNKRLVQAMLEQAISLTELAKASGLARCTITAALQGKHIFPSSVRKICAVMQRMPVQLGFAPEPDVDLDNMP
jgi:DNA-binding Xre family transcriptional regulator